MKIPRSPGNDNKIPGKKNRKPLKVLKFFFKICNTITFIIIKLNIKFKWKNYNQNIIQSYETFLISTLHRLGQKFHMRKSNDK